MAPSVRMSLAVMLVAGMPAGAVSAPAPTLPGDCNMDWSTDLADWATLQECLSGPRGGLDADCTCCDLDADNDVDLADSAAFQAVFTGTQFIAVGIQDDADDGTEVNDSIWHDDGYAGSGRNRMGAAGAESYDIGLLFHVPQVRQGEAFVYARLVVPATGDGQVDSAANLRLVGVDQDVPGAFSLVRPSQQPKTDAAVDWDLTSNWPESAEDLDCSPLHRYSPDISPIINEIVSRPGWGSSSQEKLLAVVIEDDGSGEGNFLVFQDYREITQTCPGSVSPILELYRTVRSTFVGRELLGRATDHSVTVHALSLLTLVAYFEYGAAPGVYSDQTPTVTYPGGSPIEAVIDGLLPNTRYYYRMRYRRPGEPSFAAGSERTFHTQRSPGTGFTFTVQADSHLQNNIRKNDQAGQALYRLTLRNALADDPDFHIDLGDTFLCESYNGRDVLDFDEALERHLNQRPFLDLVCHSAPFFLALGNHEGEQGWRLDGTPDNVAIWAANARKLIYPLPSPDGFYTGNSQSEAFVGLRENYYAWQWGDALFAVLDPYWCTTSKPHPMPLGGPAGSDDNWDWTLGLEQYLWFCQTLQDSSATFKFVFAHQVTGGMDTYGRGGIEAASHGLGQRGSFEWGGEDLAGDDVFDEMRPGWGQPIHEVMDANNVTIFFHGHDHVFVKQELGGVVYQECPQPNDTTYGPGHYGLAGYVSGDQVDNSGHLRVTVTQTQVVVDYVRAYLPGDGPNGEVAYSYTIPAPPPR